MKEQRGYVWRPKGSKFWWIRYNDWEIQDGTAVRKQMAAKLTMVLPEHGRLTRPPKDVQKEQERFMAKINSSRSSPERNVTIDQFVRSVWFPFIENRLAASSVHHYKFYWEHILSGAPISDKAGALIGTAKLRDFSTPAAQSALELIARKHPTMKKATLHRLKSMLSGIFRHAIQQDYRLPPNPIRETSVPLGAESEDTYAYTLDEVLKMLTCVPEPSRTVIATAAFAGLRRSEIQGLSWENYDGKVLKITQGWWEGHYGKLKSKKSRAPVPVIRPLAQFLDQHRFRCGNPDAGIMFKSKRKTPLRLNNLLNDEILPALNACEQCGKAKGAEHAGADHDYHRDPAKPQWHGFHAFRRGLATVLHDLAVDDKTIQAILRHANVAVTQASYIKTLPAQSLDAMKRLESLIVASTAVQ